MIRIVAKERVLKAKGGRRVSWKKTRTFSRLFALQKRMSRSIEIDLVKGLKAFKSKVSPEAVYQAWLSRDYSKMLAAIPWKALPEDLDGFRKQLEKGTVETARISKDTLPKQIENRLRFDTGNPFLRSYVKERTASMVVDIGRDTQHFIRQAVSQSFDIARTPRQVANQIKSGIGLYPRQEQALRNYTNMLTEKGLSEDRVISLSESYSDRLLNQRANTIARTEMRRAQNATQLDIWQQASMQGLVTDDVKKVWIVDGNPCEICLPMDGKAVALNEVWILSNGIAVSIPSESHPNCLCGMELDMGQTKDIYQDAD